MSSMHLYSHYHLRRMQEMGKVYWCHSVGAFGISLVIIFVPIFLLKIGYSFHAVLFYLFLQGLFTAVLQYPIMLMFRYFSAHSFLVVGSLFYAIFFAFLGTQQVHHWPLFLLALFWALNRAAYWPAFHYIFSSSRAHEKAGRQIAGINSLVMFASTVAPAIGGILATIFGIKYLYFAAGALMIVAILPVLKSTSAPPKVKLEMPWSEAWKMRRDVLSNIFNATINEAEQNVWPVFVFLIVASYAGVGILSTVIALASIAITLYVGRREDIDHGHRKFLQRGSTAYSLTNIGRAVVQNTTQIFGLNLLAGVGRSLYITPFMNRYYTNSDQGFRLGYIAVMETSFAVGISLYMLALFGLSFLLSTREVLEIGLASVAISSIGIRLMR